MLPEASAAISESECRRYFGATIGATPGRYVRQLRLQKAAELLPRTDERIADVGAQCGFADVSYWKGNKFLHLTEIWPKSQLLFTGSL